MCTMRFCVLQKEALIDQRALSALERFRPRLVPRASPKPKRP